MRGPIDLGSAGAMTAATSQQVALGCFAQCKMRQVQRLTKSDAVLAKVVVDCLVHLVASPLSLQRPFGAEQEQKTTRSREYQIKNGNRRDAPVGKDALRHKVSLWNQLPFDRCPLGQQMPPPGRPIAPYLYSGYTHRPKKKTVIDDVSLH